MKKQIKNDIIQKTLSFLDNEQIERLTKIIENAFIDYDVVEKANINQLEQDYVQLFLASKRIEGCSEKTLKYYKETIQLMIESINKTVKKITTEDIRRYLTEYQMRRKSSKVTIDNIRRILSSFFSWLEDEDYILKSPVR